MQIDDGFLVFEEIVLERLSKGAKRQSAWSTICAMRDNGLKISNEVIPIYPRLFLKKYPKSGVDFGLRRAKANR